MWSFTEASISSSALWLDGCFSIRILEAQHAVMRVNQLNRLMNPRAVLATSRHPLSIVNACPRAGICSCLVTVVMASPSTLQRGGAHTRQPKDGLRGRDCATQARLRPFEVPGLHHTGGTP